MREFTPLEQQIEAWKPTSQDTDSVYGSGTVDIDVSHLDKLLKQQIPVHSSYLLVHDKDGRQRKRPLNKPTFTIGKNPLGDLVIKGWFVPRTIASIDRRMDGYYLVPGKRGQVQLNGHRVRSEVKLGDSDMLMIRRTAIRFVVDKPANTTKSR